MAAQIKDNMDRYFDFSPIWTNWDEYTECPRCLSKEGNPDLNDLCTECYNSECKECGGKLKQRPGHFNFLRFCDCGTIYIIGKDGSIEHLTDLDTIREEDEPPRESIEEVEERYDVFVGNVNKATEQLAAIDAKLNRWSMRV